MENVIIFDDCKRARHGAREREECFYHSVPLLKVTQP
jgi:hypothetical protein